MKILLAYFSATGWTLLQLRRHIAEIRLQPGFVSFRTVWQKASGKSSDWEEISRVVSNGYELEVASGNTVHMILPENWPDYVRLEADLYRVLEGLPPIPGSR